MERYGASPGEWEHFCSLGLQEDLLPVVSDPHAEISPNSEVKSIGKVPSRFNGAGKVVGIPKWTKRRSTEVGIQRWQQDDRLGICIQTRTIRAIDIDVVDESTAHEIQGAFELELGSLPTRSRSNSGKRLLIVKVDGELKKSAFEVNGGRVECLGDGQQFVAVGTHPSGARYTWAAGLPTDIPEVSLAEFESAVRVVSETYGSSAKSRVGLKQSARDFDSDAALSNVSEETLLQLESALDFLGPLVAHEYDKWIKVGQALNSLCGAGFTELALGLWHKFSSAAPQYSKCEADGKWTSFTAERTDFRAIFAEAYRHGWQRPSAPAFEDDLTDAGNVAVLAWIRPGSLRFVVERGVWIYWDREKWSWDADKCQAQAAVLAISDALYARAKAKRARLQDTSLDPAARSRLLAEIPPLEKWAKDCRNRRRMYECLALAERDSRFTISVGELDQDPLLLGVANGVVDLQTGELRANSIGDFVLRRCPVRYDPAADSPRWRQFINEVTGVLSPENRAIYPRPKLAEYLHRLLGYCITGLTREHKMFIAVGEGSNGKNVLLDTVARVLGPYAQAIPHEVLMVSRWAQDAERPSPVLASLAGSRVAVSSESRDGQRLDSAVVKRQTGSGTLTARFMRENSFSFEITHKLILMTNHRPNVDQLDDAMRGRLHIVPFDVRWNRPGEVSPDARLPDGDKTLSETLKGDLEGILAWLVRGALEYQENGLEPPLEVLQVTGEYFEDQDPVGRFIRECSRCEASRGTSATSLLSAMQSWAAQAEESVTLSQKAFSQALKRHGVPSHRNDKAMFYGLTPPAVDGDFT